MARNQIRSWGRLALPMALPATLLVVLHQFPALDVGYRNSLFHLIAVSGIALCALAVAVAAAVAGVRAREHGPVWLAFGCVWVGGLMLVHGLMTPGVLGHPMNRWIGRAPYLAISLFALGVALASRPRNVRTSRFAGARPEIVLAVPVVLLGGMLARLLANPTAFHGASDIPNEELLKWVLAGIDAVIFTLTAVVHWRRWRLGHDPIQYALVLASTMSTAALGSLVLGRLWKASWWDYHIFLFIGFGAAVFSVVTRYTRTKVVDELLSRTFDSDPMVHIVGGYPDALKELIAAVERKDSYTHGHSQRTAQAAVQLGLRLGVDEDTLRAVARGGYLHDVGKIAIPDEILNKPAALSDCERAIIQTHPRAGYELVSPVCALSEALPAVLHHHERWDGTGYPDRLAASNIPLAARIVAVADVWDALTSDRSYRPGMVPTDALALIQAGRGMHFDPELVDAFVALAADWGYVTMTPVGMTQDDDRDAVIRAVESCHEVTTSRA